MPPAGDPGGRPDIGLIVHSDYGPERPDDLRRYLRRFVAAAEEHGFGSLYLPTEIGWDRWGPLAMLGALAAWTERVRVGTAVLLLPLYHPLEVAEAVATAQVVSGGRVVLGAGMGWREAEFAAAGLELRTRLGRLQDHLDVLPALLRGETVSHEGRHYRFDDVRVGVAAHAPPVPLWLGAHGRTGIVRAARRSGGWIAGPFADLALLTRQVGLYRQTRAEAGLDPGEILVFRDAWLAPTTEAALKEAEPIIDKYREYEARVGQMAFDTRQPLTDIARDRLVLGSPEDCTTQLQRFLDTAGTVQAVLRLHFRGMDPEVVLDRVALFGREVLPALRTPSDRSPQLG